jgi:uncharacterized protein
VGAVETPRCTWTRIRRRPNELSLRGKDHMPVASAIVTIATPVRYMVRLSKHFEHRVTVQRDEHSARINFPEGVCTINTTDSTLDLRIEAPAESLPRYEEVVSRHLKQVASEESFEVEWSRSD